MPAGTALKAPASSEPRRRLAQKSAKVGRNNPCPCGSGKKYKKCCGRSGR
jgi:preprotein translocase subunit SecA